MQNNTIPKMKSSALAVLDVQKTEPDDEIGQTLALLASSVEKLVRTMKCNKHATRRTVALINRLDIDKYNESHSFAIPKPQTSFALHINPLPMFYDYKDTHIRLEDQFFNPQYTPKSVFAFVTKLLSKKDPEFHTQGAKDSVTKEVTRLEAAGVWDTVPREKSDVLKQFPDAAFARIFTITGLKGSETSEPTFKSRTVLQGSDVHDQYGEQVFYDDCSSAPTSMAGIRVVHAYGMLTGSGTTSVDAEQAFIQPLMPEDEIIYIYLPENMWSPEFRSKCSGMRTPVVRLRRPLYGWKRSGNIWEHYLQDQLVSDKWFPVPDWPQMFWKIGTAGKPVVLAIYVDDFAMSGPGHQAEWNAIMRMLKTSKPEPLFRMLGVYFHTEITGPETSECLQEMNAYAKQAIDLYEAVPNAPRLRDNVCTTIYEPTAADYADQDLASIGIFMCFAASLLMKALYLGRMIRVDLCYAINWLSRYITRWTKLQDKQMTHLYSYLKTHLNHGLHGFAHCQDIGTVELHGWPDADLAGASDSTKSTSGGFLHLAAERTFLPLEWYSKRQGATATSTPEAELISASKMLREHAVPQQQLWAILLQRDVTVRIHEDNEATISIVKRGFSPQLRFLAKHHRISLSVVHELCMHDDITIQHCKSEDQKGDILTKSLDRIKLQKACDLVGLRKCKL